MWHLATVGHRDVASRIQSGMILIARAVHVSQQHDDIVFTVVIRLGNKIGDNDALVCCISVPSLPLLSLSSLPTACTLLLPPRAARGCLTALGKTSFFLFAFCTRHVRSCLPAPCTCNTSFRQSSSTSCVNAVQSGASVRNIMVAALMPV